MLRLITLSALLFNLLVALPVQAVDAVSVSPAGANVSANGASVVTLRWTVVVSSNSAQTITITSAPGTLSAGIPPLVSTTGSTLRRTFNHPGGGPVSVTITERLRVDRTSARYIAASSGGVYSRTFEDTVGSPASAVVELEAGPYGGVALQNYSLLFDDRSQYRIVERGESLAAILTVTSNGRGTFNGLWEISGPDTNGFRTIGRARVTLGGPSATTFESPALPTNRPGQYRVRFVVGGSGGDSSQEISYVVAPKTGESAISLLRPTPGGNFTGATRFEWSTIAGASRYRVEFLAPGSLRLLAAVDVRGTTAQLRPFTLARIKGLGQIVWRVTAYDGQGYALARSQSRVLGASGTYYQGAP